MRDDETPEPTPRNTGNPHADIERIASAAIGRAVRVAERSPTIVSLVVPHDTTKHGEMAVRRAVGNHLKTDVIILVALDEPPAEP